LTASLFLEREREREREKKKKRERERQEKREKTDREERREAWSLSFVRNGDGRLVFSHNLWNQSEIVNAHKNKTHHRYHTYIFHLGTRAATEEGLAKVLKEKKRLQRNKEEKEIHKHQQTRNMRVFYVKK